MVHTVAHDGERVGVAGHIGQQDEHGLVLLDSEVLGCRQCHIRNEESLDGGVFGSVDETDDAVERAGVGEGIAEEVVVVVSHTHAAKNDLVALGTHCNQRHHLVERLVRVGEEGNLLTRHERVVEVDACNTCGDEFAWLLSANRIHRGSANLNLFAFNLWAAVDGLTIGVEETSCQLIADLEGRTLAHEHDLRVGRNAARAFEDLKRHVVTDNLYHLSQLAVDGCQLIVANALCLERTRCLRYLADLCIYFLKCCCHLSYALIIASICLM